ncbi:MAG: hypothetical protein ACE5JE_05335 [Thermoplasmata archaeon]
MVDLLTFVIENTILLIFETADVHAMRTAMLATVAFIVLALTVGLLIPGGEFAPVQD